MRSINLYLLACAFIFASCGGNGSTVVGNPNAVTGFLSWSTGEQIKGATIYIPGDEDFMNETTNACAGRGGAVSCEAAPEAACSSTCTCADGSYELDVSACAERSKLKYCAQGICGEATFNCEGQACTLEVIASKNSLTRLSASVCDKMKECDVVDTKHACAFGLSELELGTSLGLDSNETLSELRVRLANQTLWIDEVKSEHCASAITDLSCAQAVQSLGIPTALGNVGALIRKACHTDEIKLMDLIP